MSTVVIVLLWIAFAGSHILLSGIRLRPRLLTALGRGTFLAVYSLVAFATFVPLVWYFLGHKHTGPLLWALPPEPYLLVLLSIGNGIGFVLLVCGVASPSPAAVTGKPVAEPRGVHLLTRHAVFMGIALWALMHLIANGHAADVAFFGGFVAFSLIGAWHQDRRKLVEDPKGFGPFHQRTPFLPFTGRDTLRGLRGLSPPAVTVGIALAAVLRGFHAELFG